MGGVWRGHEWNILDHDRYGRTMDGISIEYGRNMGRIRMLMKTWIWWNTDGVCWSMGERWIGYGWKMDGIIQEYGGPWWSMDGV